MSCGERPNWVFKSTSENSSQNKPAAEEGVLSKI